MAYRVQISFLDDHDDYYLEDEFETKEEAEDAADGELSNWSAGAEVLDMMGEYYTDPSLISYDIEEV